MTDADPRPPDRRATLEALLALAPGHAHGRIRLLQQMGQIPRIVGKVRDTDAGRHGDFLLAEHQCPAGTGLVRALHLVLELAAAGLFWQDITRCHEVPEAMRKKVIARIEALAKEWTR